MDLNVFRRISSSPKPTDPRTLRTSLTKSGFISMKLLKILAACLVAFPVLFTLVHILRNPPPDRVEGLTEARALERIVVAPNVSENGSSRPSTEMPKDKLLGGLLVPGFDEGSCLSRYESSLYRKPSLRKPSSYLLSRLRSYEDLHKRCGPHTRSYNITLEQLKSKSGQNASSTECNYVVWMSYSGLGNRILTLASAFLYALLTNRVLLVDPGKNMFDLFCEPFPEKTWFLPFDFPLKNQFNMFDQNSPYCHGNMLKNNKLKAESIPPYLYLHLTHDYKDHDKLFFCDQEQALLSKVPWLIMKTDNYFVPSLFLIPSFEQELSKLFPEKETIFHHLGRYLFHPSNHVWGLITRYYEAYLSKADERIGLQIRVLEAGNDPLQHVMYQILACTLKEKLLPKVDRKRINISSQSGNKRKSKAILVTSLYPGYAEKLRNMYWEHPTVNGEVIEVYQPSHEEIQKTENKLHDRKAWAEMYLLSLTDVLVTSGWSTFGYVAQGLGGMEPWILFRPENKIAPNPPCRRAMSMEPCFHAPPFYDCKAKRGADTGKIVPHVRHCEDISWGLKVVDSRDEL